MNFLKSVNPVKNRIINIIIIIVLVIFTIILFRFLYSNKDNIMKFINPVDLNDKTPPSMVEVSIKSDNNINSKLAEEGNTIELKFKPSEELDGLPRVKINNKDVNVYKRGNYYVAYYTVLDQKINDNIVNFIIYDYKDRNNNKGSNIINTTDNSSVTIVSSGTIIK